MENISIDEFYKISQDLSENHLILDVRTPEEFSQGHIKGSTNKTHEEVPLITEDLKKYEKVYVHCKMGGRAQIASQALREAGLENIICVSQGGMERWMEMGWPVEK